MADPIMAAFKQIEAEFKKSPRNEIQTLYVLFEQWVLQAADAAELGDELIDQVKPDDKVAENAIMTQALITSHLFLEAFAMMNAIRLADITARLEKIEGTLEFVKEAVDPTQI